MYGLKKYFKKVLCGTLAAVVALQMAAVSVTAQESDSEGGITPEVLFEDNFDSGSLREEWQVPESAEVNVVDDGTGNYVMRLRPVDGEWGTSIDLFPGKSEWQDYSVEADFAIEEWIDHGDAGMKQYDNVGLAGRSHTSPEQRWEIMYRRASQTFELNKYHYSSGGNKVEESSYELEPGKLYKIKLVFSGDTVSAYCAPKDEEYGEAIFTGKDSGNYGAPTTCGGIKLSACGAQAIFDNVKVVGVETTIPVEKVELDKTEVSLEKGEKVLLNATVTPSTVSDKSVIWSSGNEEVAIVDKESGMVTAQGEGTTVITATSTADPTKMASCKVTVYETAECSTFYYVSTTGSDENPGTEEAPFATLQKARDTIRQLETLPDGGVTVYLRGGEYYQEETIIFTPEDSGEAGKPIVYTSYPGEQAVITGGKDITGWVPLEEEVPYMAEEAKGNLYVADIETGWRFHDLYVDGECQQISQQMETKQFRTWPQFSGAIGEEDSKFLELNPEKGIKVRFNEGELDGLTDNPDIEVNCMTVMFWNALPLLTEINEEDNTAYLYSYNPSNLGDNMNSFNTKEGGWYNILNDIKYLDQPGEWCVNSREGKVYYWPKDSNFTSKRVVAPVPYELVRFQGDDEDKNWENLVHHITLSNLVIEYNDRLPESQFDQYDVIRNTENPDASVYFQNAENCQIINCTIQHSGSYGITLSHHAQNIEILGNELGDLGSGGVNFFGYGPGTLDVNKNNTVMYNNIHDLGLAPYPHTAGITLYQSGSNTISYNYISKSPYAGVTILGEVAVGFNSDKFSAAWDFFGNMDRQYGFRWDDLELHKDYTREEVKEFTHSRNNVIEYNIVDEYMTGVEDGGGLYAWGCGNDNRYSNNIIIKTEKGMHWTFPLYMDDGVDNITVENNLVWSMEQGTIDKGYGSNTWVDNKFSWPEKPEGYDELKTHIINTVEAMTGKSLFDSVERVTLQRPDNQAENISQPDYLTWTPCSNATTYQVEVATDSAFTDIVFTQMTSDSEIALPDLDFGKTYYWRVASCVMAEPMVYSDTYSFTMIDESKVITVEGEDFTQQSGIQLENDGSYAAYIDDGDWMEYQVHIENAGEYKLNYKVSVNNAMGQVEFLANGESLAVTNLPTTGGWQNYQRVTDTVTFTEPGTYTIRLNVLTGGWNLDKFEFIQLSAPISANKTLLQKTYEYALALSTEGVTDSAKKFFEDALAEAKAVLDNEKATQEEVNAAWDNLLKGIWGLGLTQGDKTMLEQLIAKADEMMAESDKYVQDNWQQLIDALAAAKDIYNDGDAMEEDIEPAAEALLNAILAQRFKADKSILEDLVNKAEGMDLSGYTAESVAVFAAAFQNAKAVLADETLSEDDQGVVDEAVEELKAAIQNLSTNDDGDASDNGDTSKPDDDKNNGSQENETSKPQSPVTGDSTNVIWLVAVLAVAGCGFAVCIVRRKNRA